MKPLNAIRDLNQYVSNLRTNLKLPSQAVSMTQQVSTIPAKTSFKSALNLVNIGPSPLDPGLAAVLGDPDALKNHLASLDTEHARLQLAMILADSACCKKILTWRGDSAQFMIDLLQSVGNNDLINPKNDSNANIQSHRITFLHYPKIGGFSFAYLLSFRGCPGFIQNVWCEKT